MSDNWYEEMEQAEQEYDNLEYEKNLAYQQGRADGFREGGRKIFEGIKAMLKNGKSVDDIELWIKEQKNG